MSNCKLELLLQQKQHVVWQWLNNWKYLLLQADRLLHVAPCCSCNNMSCAVVSTRQNRCQNTTIHCSCIIQRPPHVCSCCSGLYLWSIHVDINGSTDSMVTIERSTNRDILPPEEQITYNWRLKKISSIQNNKLFIVSWRISKALLND